MIDNAKIHIFLDMEEKMMISDKTLTKEGRQRASFFFFSKMVYRHFSTYLRMKRMAKTHMVGVIFLIRPLPVQAFIST